MNEPKNSVSFVIPVYNAARYLENCLKSIRAQNYPQDNVEIIIADGGSSDETLKICERFSCKVLSNPKRLAEYGVQLGIGNAEGNYIVIFAADNELVGSDWIFKVINIFHQDQRISAVWGRLVSGQDDSSLNKYFELIQSDPLNWFINQNLLKYLSCAETRIGDCYIFNVDLRRPLVWGANGLVYKAGKIKQIWSQEGYLGDNDAFQYMIEQGNNKVAYFRSPFVYHHHIARLGDWVKKWKRNFAQHLLGQYKTRNMGWVFVGNFKLKLFFWVLYSGIPVFSLLHSMYLALKDRSIYWFYHPLASFLQSFTYFNLTIFSKKGRSLIKNIIFADK